MTDYFIVPAAQTHVGPHVAALPEQVRQAIMKSGTSPRRFMRGLLFQSSRAWAAILAGRPVALWGVAGQLLQSRCHIWLSVAPEARACRFALARGARRQMETLCPEGCTLESLVSLTDMSERRFTRFLGFEEHEIVNNPEMAATAIRVTWQRR